MIPVGRERNFGEQNLVNCDRDGLDAYQKLGKGERK